jgi:hypothetical protein
LQAQAAHQPVHAFAVDHLASAPQPDDHPPAAEERRAQALFVDALE